ncbi:MAG: extracellular solute-binding protein [Oscillospiraceae bacterium]|nr:extracellular solute-binding protein [Oscillospiraceae bacterium]
MKKRILSIILAAFMLLAMLGATGCGGEEKPEGGGQNNTNNGTNNNNTGGTSQVDASGVRTIRIGTWFDMYYTSQHQDVYDNPEVSDVIIAEMELENMRKIEQEHNVRLEYINLTWNGIQESLTTSIMAGRPDVDVYLVDLQFGIPTVLSGFATSLEGMELAGTDVFTDNVVMQSLNLGQDDTYLFRSSLMSSIPNYLLAFNLDMLKEHNLENPQDLWDRGEWTWDKWQEYMVEITDTQQNIFGWSGYWTNMLENLVFSNGSTIASGPVTTVTAAPTIEVFEFIFNMYNTWRVARPWDESNWEVNNNMYARGLSGFWVTADWLMGEQGGGDLPFEVGVVPWPVGPSGNQATNKHGSVGGNWYMIPRGIDNPRQVYNVMFDWLNWYDYDREIAEDLEWSRNQYITDRNFDYAMMMALNTGFDIWESLGLGDGFSMVEIMEGEKTASQYAEEVRNVIQDALDNFFG